VLFLSPHLDDAVLSCPVWIQRLVRRGTRVRIATVFTEGDELYRKRRAEDRAAARELGVSVTHLGFPDAPYRSPRYSDFCGIAFGCAREYPATCRLVARGIGELLTRWRPHFVVSPMAVGNHVDHRLVRDAALTAARSADLRFYEDRPYAFIREQVQHVLGRSLALRPPRFWRRYFAATYVRSYRGSTTEARIRKGWETIPAFPHRLRAALRVRVEPDEVPRTLAAIRRYRTQIPDLFAGNDELDALYAAVPETFYRIG
jgi:LmbE family N-acetylglucosaminyl deacetylase